MTKRFVRLVVIAGLMASYILAMGGLTASGSNHESLTDFEPSGFVPGQSVDDVAPDGTVLTPPGVAGVNPDAQAWSVREEGVDEEVVDLTGGDPNHGKVWRLSDANPTGNLQLRPHAPKYLGFSGEPGAIDDFGSESVTSNTYFASLDFRSATGAAQADLEIDVTPACGDDCRHGYVRIVDDAPNGFDLVFFETGTSGFNTFLSTPIDLNLSYTDWHTIALAITFVDGINSDGTGNDIVEVYVNNQLVHTGTSWETGYRISTSSERGVDRLAFAASSEGAADENGGIYFDNVFITDVIPVIEPPVATIACVNEISGKLRIVKEGAECAYYERVESWFQGSGEGEQIIACVNPLSGVVQIASNEFDCVWYEEVVTWDRGTGTGPQITACVNLFWGTTRIVDDSSECMWWEKVVMWDDTIDDSIPPE